MKKEQQVTFSEPFSSSIVNSGEDATDQVEAANTKALFTSTDNLLTEELELSRELLWTKKRWAILDVWFA